MEKYIVTCTKIYNGTIEVEAENKEEALEIADENLDDVDWVFGEATADYAEEATDLML